MHMHLDRDWTLERLSGPVPRDVAAAGPIAASVPGSVHTDLLAACPVPDPYPGRPRAGAHVERVGGLALRDPLRLDAGRP
jgi:hypothetical protein